MILLANSFSASSSSSSIVFRFLKDIKGQFLRRGILLPESEASDSRFLQHLRRGKKRMYTKKTAKVKTTTSNHISPCNAKCLSCEIISSAGGCALEEGSIENDEMEKAWSEPHVSPISVFLYISSSIVWSIWLFFFICMKHTTLIA